MVKSTVGIGDHVVIHTEHLQALIDILRRDGYQVLGPTPRDATIVYDEIETVGELPVGWIDRHDAGTYRLEKRGDDALFGYNLGAQSWKKFLHPGRRLLWQAVRSHGNGDFEFIETKPDIPRRAFLGVRACEIGAIAIQHRVFTQGSYVDPLFKSLHDSTFIIAVNCSQASGTCFCTSMGSGPQVKAGFDLALTEIMSADRHVLVIEIGSEAGASVAAELDYEPASAEDCQQAEQIVAKTAATMGRSMDVSNIKEFLYANAEHPRWEEIANRCLSCSNCTNVCPTCFCTSVEDTTDLSGQHAERWQRWDSCFTLDFSYIHGGSIRSATHERYRQWMTHKLAAWFDQFGSSGCVGCGRCITWCPVGIDITEEVHAMRENDLTNAQISTLNMV